MHRMKAVRQGKWKHIVDNYSQLLIDLDADISERQNLFYQHPDIAQRLRESLSSWETSIQSN